jgi:hypothetical protein
MVRCFRVIFGRLVFYNYWGNSEKYKMLKHQEETQLFLLRVFKLCSTVYCHFNNIKTGWNFYNFWGNTEMYKRSLIAKAQSYITADGKSHFKHVNNCLNTNIHSYIVVQVVILIKMLFMFSTLVLIRHPWHLTTVAFLHWCLICAVLLCRVFKS